MCKQQNQSDTKTFRIRHESETISFSENLQCSSDKVSF